MVRIFIINFKVILFNINCFCKKGMVLEIFVIFNFIINLLKMVIKVYRNKGLFFLFILNLNL